MYASDPQFGAYLVHVRFSQVFIFYLISVVLTVPNEELNFEPTLFFYTVIIVPQCLLVY